MLRELILVLCFCSIDLGIAHDFKTEPEHQLSDETVFSINSYNAGKYEAIKSAVSNSRVRREAGSIEVDLEVDGETHELNLIQSERNVYSAEIPVWMVKHMPNKNPSYVYEAVSKDKQVLNDDMYVDEEQMASLRVSRNSRDRKYFGVFGKGARKHFARDVRGKLRSRASTKHSQDSIKPVGHSTDLLKNATKLAKTKLLEKPLDTLYVEVLPVVDYHLFKSLGMDVTETLRYVSVFWNEVDLMFRKLDSPKVQIAITGIVIAEDITSLEYVQKSLHENRHDRANPIEMREFANKYFYRYFFRDTGFRNYDIAMIMTALDTGLISGSSDRGKACDRAMNTGVIGDNAKFSGVHPATHEIGHFINLPHDGHQDAENCDPYAIKDKMTVMAPVQKRVNEYYWSNCSKDILKNFAKLKIAECLTPPAK